MQGSSKNSIELKVEEGRFTFQKPGVGGWFNLGFGLNSRTTRGQKTTVEKNGNVTLAWIDMNGWEEQLTFEVFPETQSLTLSRVVKNTGLEKLFLSNVIDGLLDTSSRVEWEGLHEYTVRLMHTQNARTENFPRSRPESPYLRPIPYLPVKLGEGEANHLPALLITDENYSVGLVEGDLNQTRFERIWSIGLNGEPCPEKSLIRTYQAQQEACLSNGAVTLDPEESLQVSCVYYQIQEGVHPDSAYQDYFKALADRHSFRGPISPMREHSVFCTWNYGTLSNIDEELIARRAKAVANRIPNCKYFLIDDGFQDQRGKRNGPLDTYYPNPVERYDRKKFPHGMKATAEGIRECGLKPAIWLSPTVYLESPLAKEHPEWLLCDEFGDSGILGKCTYLDLSVPEAQTFFLEVLDALLVEWGYEGVKFDFMTQWFTLEKARFRNGGTGPEWRDWTFEQIRRRIGPDGFLMTCIAMSMGNPFPGQYADCYRCGCDIHDGTWEEQLKSVKATLPQILLEGRKTFLLNMDSAGFGEIPENEQIFRLTWIFITQGIIELGGPVEHMPTQQIELWNRMLTDMDRGHHVRCPDLEAFSGSGLPEWLVVDYPEDSKTRQRGLLHHVALFNWSNTPRTIDIDWGKAQITAPASMKDFWTDDLVSIHGHFSITLPGHSAKLYSLGDFS